MPPDVCSCLSLPLISVQNAASSLETSGPQGAVGDAVIPESPGLEHHQSQKCLTSTLATPFRDRQGNSQPFDGGCLCRVTETRGVRAEQGCLGWRSDSAQLSSAQLRRLVTRCESPPADRCLNATTDTSGVAVATLATNGLSRSPRHLILDADRQPWS